MEHVKMVYVGASYCNPCHQMVQPIAELKAAGWNIEKLDADVSKDFVVQNQVSSIPTFIIYRHGVQVDRFIGARTKQSLLNALNRAI